MKAIDILFWVIRESVDGENLNFTFVPEIGSEVYDQNDEWWKRIFGGCPSHPIPSGEYIFFYGSKEDADITDGNGAYHSPDAIIETDEDTIYFYKIDD